MRRAGLALSLLLPLAAPRSARAGDGPWELVSNKDGIVVERRTVEGSHLKEFRGRAVLDAPLASLLAVFTDVAHATEWMDRCAASSLVEDDGDLRKVVYNRTHATWPVSDRDAVLRNEVFFEPALGRVRLEFVSVTRPDAPPVKGVVRMPYVRGHWYFWPQRDGKTRVEYQVHADPGGALPDWLVNYVSRELPRKTIVGLGRQVERRHDPRAEAHIRGLDGYRALVARAPAADGS